MKDFIIAQSVPHFCECCKVVTRRVDLLSCKYSATTRIIRSKSQQKLFDMGLDLCAKSDKFLCTEGGGRTVIITIIKTSGKPRGFQVPKRESCAFCFYMWRNWELSRPAMLIERLWNRVYRILKQPASQVFELFCQTGHRCVCLQMLIFVTLLNL